MEMNMSMYYNKETGNIYVDEYGKHYVISYADGVSLGNGFQIDEYDKNMFDVDWDDWSLGSSAVTSHWIKTLDKENENLVMADIREEYGDTTFFKIIKYFNTDPDEVDCDELDKKMLSLCKSKNKKVMKKEKKQMEDEVMTNNNSYLVRVESEQLHYCLNLMFAEFVRSRELDEKTTQAYVEYYYSLVDGDYYDCQWFAEPKVIDIKKTVLDDMFDRTIVFHNKQEMFDKYPEYNNDFDKIGDDHHLFVASNGYIIFNK